MPILVCLGTTAVLELRRMALRGDEGRALDELRASEQKLNKMVQVRERKREVFPSCVRDEKAGAFERSEGNEANSDGGADSDQTRSPLSGSEIQTAAKGSKSGVLFFSSPRPSLRSVLLELQT